LWNCPPSSCHGVLYPRYYGLVGTFSCKTAPARGTRGVVLLSPRVWKGCHCLGTRDGYLMHYSNPFVTGGQKHTHTLPLKQCLHRCPLVLGIVLIYSCCCCPPPSSLALSMLSLSSCCRLLSASTSASHLPLVHPVSWLLHRLLLRRLCLLLRCHLLSTQHMALASTSHWSCCLLLSLSPIVSRHLTLPPPPLISRRLLLLPSPLVSLPLSAGASCP
jgi:hypothetical protein